MIIYNFNIICAALIPGKTKAPLIVNPDDILTFSVATQGMKSVAWI